MTTHRENQYPTSRHRNRNRVRPARQVRPDLAGHFLLESRLLLSADATATVVAVSSPSIRETTSVTVTATVSDITVPANTPTGGTVTFRDGTTTLATVMLNNGTAGFSTSALTKGTHYITAIYSGAGAFAGSLTGVTPTSTIETIAGNGTYGPDGDGGPALSAAIGFPIGVVGDSAGNLYIADYGDCIVRKIAADGTISTYAGVLNESDSSGNGGPANQAHIGDPYGLALDAQGNLYIANEYVSVVYKVTPDGIIHTFAGTGTVGNTGDNGLATSAELDSPQGVATDADGNVYIIDTGANVIRKVTPDGIIHTVVGTGTSGYFGDGGPATSAELARPFAMIVDPAGNMFIVDAGNNVIREVTTDGKIHTVVGNGTAGYFGDGGAATSAELRYPQGIALDAYGDLFILDNGNNVVREVTTDGIIQTIVGNGTSGFSGDGGPANQAELSNPYGVTVDPAGNLIVNDSGNSRVRVLHGGVAVAVTTDSTSTALNVSSHAVNRGSTVTLTATVSDVTNTGTKPTGLVTFMDGTAVLGTASLVNGVATFSTTSLSVGHHSLTAAYAAQAGFEAGVSGITSSSLITTVAGDGTADYKGDGGPATSAELSFPSATATDAAGNLYIADYYNAVVRKVTPGGIISTFAGNGVIGYSGDSGQATSAELGEPTGLAFDSAGNLYIADYEDHVVRKVTPGGIISTFAGNGTADTTGDGGQATLAELNGPAGLAFDSAGNLYIADNIDSVIRKVTPGGIISTIAGVIGTAGYTGNGGPATSAELFDPLGIAFDAADNLYIADGNNNVIRKVTPGGIITTVAGDGMSGYTGDGSTATLAGIDTPTGVAVDRSGNLFIADSAHHVIREVTADGNIYTVIGNGSRNYTGDGGPAGSATLNYPQGIAFDASGSLYIADSDNNVVRKVEWGQPVDVSIAQTQTTVAASPASSVHNQSVTFTATVANLSSSLTPDGGTVTFSDGETVLGTANLVNGTATFTTTALITGTHPITAVYGGDGTNFQGSSTTASLPFTVAPYGPATNFAVTGAAGGVAGTAENVGVTAYDAFGNVALGYTGTVHFTSSDPNAVLPADATLTNGTGTFAVTLKKAGSDSITATDTVSQSISGTETGIVVTPGAASAFQLTATPPVVAGSVSTYTVTAYDPYGNIATGYEGTVHVTSSDPNAILPADTKLTDGVAAFSATLKTVGLQSITAADVNTPALTGTLAGIDVRGGIKGTVFLDTNANGVQDPGEPGMSGRVLYLDLAGTGVFTTGDPAVTTDASGHFTFAGAAPGSAAVREALGQDTYDRYDVSQTTTNADQSLNIGVVPYSPVSPLSVVPNPFQGNTGTTANAGYVQSLYKAVLGRVGSDSEVSGWVGKINSGMPLTQVAAGFVTSTEHRAAEVASYYTSFLHRAADSGSSHWMSLFASGASEQDVVKGILNSSEYQSEHKDPALYVRDLYLDVLGRQGTDLEVSNYTKALSKGTSRSALLSKFVDSGEAHDQIVESLYVSWLNRPREDGTTSDVWTIELSRQQSVSAVTEGFLTNPEFVTKAKNSNAGKTGV